MPVNDPDEFEEKTTASIAEAFDVMVEASGIVHHNAVFLSKVVRSFYVKALRPMTYIVVGMIMIMVLQQLSLVNRDQKIEDLQDTVVVLDQDVRSMQKSADDSQEAAQEAKVASEAAKQALEEALAQSQRGGVSPEVVDALKRINDIYTTCVERKEC